MNMPAHDEEFNGASRRHLLIAGAVAAVGAALAAGNVNAAAVEVLMADESETPITRLYREWQRIDRDARAFPLTGTGLEGDGAAEDALLDRLFYNERDRIGAELMALRCQTPGDFAVKVIIDTCHGQLFEDFETGRIWIEARSLIGGAA